MPNPFDVDDDAKEDDAKPIPAPARPAEKLEKDEDGAVEVDTTPDDEDDDGPAAAAGNRTERRRERGRLHKEAEEARADNERLRLENTRLSAERAALEAVRGYQARAEQQPDPIDQEIARVTKAKTHLYDAYTAKQDKLTPAELEQYRKDAAELNDRHDQLKHQKYNRAAGVGRPQEDPETAAIRAGLNMMYPDVMANEQAKQYALAAFNMRRIGKMDRVGEQEDVAEAMRLTREKYGMKGSKPPPTEASKRKYMGSSGGAAPRGGPGPGKFVMTKEMQRVADETYSHIKDPAVRYKTWATKVGPKFQELRARRGEGKRV
jgi:hypothetical protein